MIKYETPDMKITCFDAEDIILTSGEDNPDTEVEI